MIAVRFVGGNHSDQPHEKFAPRDGYGAILEVDLEAATLVREHRAGEGFAAQNSATLVVGLGEEEGAKQLRVRWPSGEVHEIGPVAANTLLTVYENPVHSGNVVGHRREPYRVVGLAKAAAQRAVARLENRRIDFADIPSDAKNSKLRLFMTMATWCPACKGELPQLALLRKVFGQEQLDLLAVPVDEADTREMLEEYERLNRPAYRIMKDLDDAEIEFVKQIVVDDLKKDALPAAILTDRDGRVIQTLWEVPSVSEVLRVLEQVRS
jgi:thiol-disulfide isomerase/thioredoxin